MRKIVSFLVVVLSFSCSSQKNTDVTNHAVQNDTIQALTEIDSLDHLLKEAYHKDMEHVPTELIEKTIQAQKDFVFRFPQHAYTPEALDKIHQLYGQLGSYHFAVEYGEMLLQDFPNYKKKNLVKYSIATSYDYLLHNSTRAITLYKELLQDTTISDYSRSEITERLKQIEK